MFEIEQSKFPIAPIPKPTPHELAMDAQRAEPGGFGKWLEANPEPSLRTLAEQHGGLGRVPHDAWIAYDQEFANWRARFRLRAIGSATR